MKYRKKPVVIEAIQWNENNLDEIKAFAGESVEYWIADAAWEAGVGVPMKVLHVLTLEGRMNVSKDDYIIKGIKGEFYPCKPDIFEQTYELVE